jgi:excisionase family DNA binding protein
VKGEGLMEKLLLTVDETAELLGVGRWKVFELIRQEQLASVKFGGLRRIPRDAVYAFVEEISGNGGAVA